MPAFHDCIYSARDQGVLSEDEADALIARYNEHADALRSSGERDVEAGAKAALAREADEASARQKQLAALAQQKRDEIAGYLQTYRDKNGKPDVFNGVMNLIENFGFGAGESSMANMAKAKFNLAIGELGDLLSTFRRTKLLGRRMNKPLADDIVREIHGEATGKPEARAMADATQGVFDRLREEFNTQGGNIGKLDGGYLPQFHDPRAVLKAGFQGWRDYIVPRLDMDKMRDPMTGGALSPARLDETMRVAWEHIATGGWSDREPQARPFGIGSLANQRAEHRFLHFKTADDWLAYNRDFGKGDPIQSIFQHVRGMTRDIAAMERLGPNPGATVEWLKQVVQSEMGKQVSGKPSLYTPRSTHIDPERSLPWRIDALYNYVRGQEVVSGKVATFFGSVRNVLTSAQLGGTSILAAAQDPFIDMAARHMSGIPAGKALYGIAQSFSRETKETAARAGLGLDDFMHIMGEEARYAGTLGGAEWSRWLADRTVHLNGLEPMTQGRKHLFGLEFMGAMADHAQRGFDDLPPALRRTMADYGLTTKDWDKLRAVDAFHPDPGSAGVLRPVDVAQKNRKLAERYLEMILGQTERAVPTGTGRSRSLLTGVAQRGTVMGEILQSGLQYKSFGLSFTTMQWQALAQEVATAKTKLGAVARGAGYAGGMIALPLTLAGGLAMQLQNLVAGKDIQAMDTPRFWIAALQKGGGLGIMGDYMFADMNRFGHPFIESAAGPMIGLMADIAEPPIRLMQKGVEGKKTNPGREAVKFIGRYTPIVSTLPYTRMAYRRMFLDQLQYLVDPEAHKAFRQQEQKLKNETGQGFYWRSGETSPSRAPEWAASPRH